MASPNRIKQYIKGAYYHIYNRGVAKQDVFIDEFDYLRFIHKIYHYKKNLVKIIAYCLMPNHYHILVQNNNEKSIEKYIRSLATSHAMYFNRKYARVGHLFQDIYKARLITSDEDFLHIIEYILKNPIELENGSQNWEEYPYSSYKNHINT